MANIKANDEKWLGQKYGKLTVIGFVYKNNRWLWECKCECGNIAVVYPQQVMSGRQKACHCGKSTTFREMHYKHGGSGSRLYSVWCDMRKRCNNPNHNRYARYGGRGIKVCEEWNDFSVFESWALSNGYSDDLTIDRISNDGDYAPDNCRWVNNKLQSQNRSSNIPIVIDGETKTLGEWCELYSLKYSTVYSRIYRGMKPYDALMKDVLNKR